MSNGKIKSRYLTNPYLFSLNLLAVIVVSVPYLYFIPQIIRSCEDWRVPAVLIGFYLPCILLGFFNAYNYYGWIHLPCRPSGAARAAAQAHSHAL